ncbi:N-formylglutamate amidohydrolase [Roseovarius sp. C7]|uniref:N-formylglutamate amidohydrolase n=1 Tax=Roseovarius sp. C7 TaxID=3398643 RepID=UPI0039F4D8CD
MSVSEAADTGRDPGALLGPGDPPPVEVINPEGKGGFVFGCEHAGNLIPAGLGTLGLTAEELTRHIAWDIGAARLTALLSEDLDSLGILQRYSRLVYDCNRTASHPGAFIVDADGTHVSGNAGLTADDRAARETAIYRPFQEQASELTASRQRRAERFAYVAVHSFNAQVRGQARPWHVGVLYNQHSAMSHFLIRWFRENTGWQIGDNQPYSPLDAVDHTLRMQAETRSIPCTMIEVRNDLLRSEEQISSCAALLAQGLRAYAAQEFG